MIRSLRKKRVRAKNAFNHISTTAIVEREFADDSDSCYLSEDEVIHGIMARVKKNNPFKK